MRYVGMRQEYINEHIHKRLEKLEKPTNCQDKYNELRSVIQEQLRLLRPWYEGGSVGNPNIAIEALRKIDAAVNNGGR